MTDDAHPARAHADVGQRPGVYVQVSGGPRRRKSSSKVKPHESGDHIVEEVVVSRPAHVVGQAPAGVRRGPGPMGMGGGSANRVETAPRSDSQVRERHVAPYEQAPSSSSHPAPARGQIREINESVHDARTESENTNYRADIVRVSVPPNAGSIPPSDHLSAPSVLDAKPRLHSEPPAPARTPWGLIVLVGVMSSIIAAAMAIAVQEWRSGADEKTAASAPESQTAAPAARVEGEVPAPAAANVAASPAVEPKTARPAAPARVAAPKAATATADTVGANHTPEVAEPSNEAQPAAKALPEPAVESAAAPASKSRPHRAAKGTFAEVEPPSRAVVLDIEPKKALPIAPVAEPAPMRAPSELPENPFEPR